MEQVIQVEHLSKSYGPIKAVNDISFRVQKGEVFGIVGPNGAGKTTAMELLTGLRHRDQGEVKVLGLDPQNQSRELHQRVGVQLQQAALPERIKVWEVLDLYSSFYRHTVDWKPLLEHWDLADKRNTIYKNLSGGQKQRLFITLALLNDPEVVFLDELTAGLDPQARRLTWEVIRDIRDQGTTVVLVTHFMEEAERLCDRVAVIDHGSVVALDTPQRLISSLGSNSRVTFSVFNGFDPDWLRTVPGVSDVRRTGNEVVVAGSGPFLAEVATALAERGQSPSNLRTEQAGLEDVFVALTGRKIRD